jgi:hypothetical protein
MDPHVRTVSNEKYKVLSTGLMWDKWPKHKGNSS